MYNIKNISLLLTLSAFSSGALHASYCVEDSTITVMYPGQKRASCIEISGGSIWGADLNKIIFDNAPADVPKGKEMNVLYNGTSIEPKVMYRSSELSDARGGLRVEIKENKTN